MSAAFPECLERAEEVLRHAREMLASADESGTSEVSGCRGIIAREVATEVGMNPAKPAVKMFGFPRPPLVTRRGGVGELCK